MHTSSAMADTETFDCFLCHNSRDKPAVRALAAALGARGVVVWLDEARLRPGLSAQRQMDSGIRQSRSIAVLVGADGLGPWEQEEMEAALSLAVRDGRPVIPVLLPDAPRTPPLPLFLASRAGVDLRPSVRGEAAGLDDLIWGITGERPTAAGPAAIPAAGVGSTPAVQGPLTTAPPIRILHLSDLHLRTDRTWDADPVLAALARFIAAEVRAGLVPDLVAITGDLAYSGKAAEYRLAYDWLECQLWPALTPAGAALLPRDRLLLVPGNHDVDRGAVDFSTKAVQKALLEDCDQDDIATVLGNPSQRAPLLSRHAAWLDFCAGWYGLAPDAPWWQRTLTLGTQRLHCAGLDSAWMSARDREQGALLLGRWQVHQTVLARGGTDADWTLALLHHPWSYLDDRDTAETRTLIHLHRDLVLRGHRHQTDSAQIVRPDPKRTCLELAAGCVYDGSPYANAFQWIELRPATAGAPRRVRVLFRAWVQGAWQVDRNQHGCPDGIAEFRLDEPTDPAAAPASPARPQVPPVYQAWLRQRLSGMDLLGQEVQQGLSVTLGQVYVPALTSPERTPEPTPGDDRVGPSLDLGRLVLREEPPPAFLLERIAAASVYCPAPAGAGKSTFCRWAVLKSLPGSAPAHPVPPPEGYAEPPPVGLRERLPLLVPLREFWECLDGGHGRRLCCREELTQALAAWVDQRLRPDGLDGALLRAHLAAGSAFLLLDGLDEVPVTTERAGVTHYPRALLLAGLTDARPTWEAAGNRLLLTSRPYGLEPHELTGLGLPSTPLEPLPEALQQLFVQRWFATLDTPDLTAGLLATLDDRPDLAPLAENPLLLTALCVIYGTGKRLPEDRYHLYQRIVDNVLYHRYPGDHRAREPVKARLEAIALGMHTGTGFDRERRTPEAEASAAELERLLRRFADLNPAYESGRVTPALWREDLLTRSGLLLPRPDGRAAFHHLSFQEFLAAERIARTSDDRAALERVFRERAPVPEWRATLLFLFAAQVFNYRDAQWGLDLLCTLAADLDRAAVRGNAAPAVLVAEALELCIAKGYAVPEGLSAGFRQTCLDAIADEIAIPDRQALGLSLGRLGDPRVLSLRDPAAYCEVSAGDYPYGEGKKAERVRIAEPFLLSRYPVTNSQYREFMEAGGYTRRDWWSDEGWAWREETGASEPAGWQLRKWNAPNQPVVGVSFWEAQACCRWAGGRLPSEHEWEAAARGPEGHEYPWGGAWEDGICNSEEARLGVTSPVGLFPRSRQARLPLDDLAGNVWEWCDDFYDPNKTAGGSSRVLRGGSFGDESRNLRAADRDRGRPEDRDGGLGFRCVLGVRARPVPSTH